MQNITNNAIMQQILQQNKDNTQTDESIVTNNQQTQQMPELALRCAQFFHSMSQYCLYFYKNYNREADIHKTKFIKKSDKSKKDSDNKSKRSKNDNRRSRYERGQGQPEPPKKPLTAYILYFQDKKPSFAEKFPSLSLSQLTKLIAKDWKDLTQEQKKPYLDKAADDRKRYENQMIQFKKKYHNLNKEGQQGEQGIQVVINEQDKSPQKQQLQIGAMQQQSEVQDEQKIGQQGIENEQDVSDSQDDQSQGKIQQQQA